MKWKKKKTTKNVPLFVLTLAKNNLFLLDEYESFVSLASHDVAVNGHVFVVLFFFHIVAFNEKKK